MLTLMPIDLRSDTVTRPSPAMRDAMMRAEVGDDVFVEDPTVNSLEARFADLAGKERALFVASGTMGNQICLRCHTQPADEVICDAASHIVQFEAGAPAALWGLSIRGIVGDRGIFTAAQVRSAVSPDNVHLPHTALVVVENTNNRGGGSVWPIETVQEVCATARELGLRTHLDGARIFNAVVATGVPLRTWAENFDSISVCFSKSLGAPVGSIIAGSKEFIARARRVRKMLGGGMRQAGILAAAAAYALDHNIDRLAEDHANAHALAEVLSQCPAFDVEDAPTNMVFWSLRGTREQALALNAACRESGVLFNCVGGTRFRAVTHLDVTRDQVLRAGELILQKALQPAR